MQIVPLADRKEFIEELAELHHAEWSYLNPSQTLQKRTEAISNAAGREGIPSFFIAIAEHNLLGSAALVQHDMDTKPELFPWLAAVYVKENFRHQGIATLLITRCEQEAAQSGADRWYLYTEFATPLYQKLGWNHLEGCVYKGATVNVMYKNIACY